VTGDFSPQPKPFSPNGAPTDLAGPGAVPLRTGLQALPGEQGYLAGQYPLYAARSTAQAVYVSPYGSAVNATRLQLAGSVFFARGSANLAPASVASLQEVAAAQRQTGRPLQILGSASANRAGSNLGSNAALSLARAHAVANRLVALGVPANLVEIVGVGDTRARGLDIPTDRRVDIYLAY
jgi:outer membrane protein OmpA-like peptidoglycan-associated protein